MSIRKLIMFGGNFMYENENEVWVNCPKFGKKYEISSLGRIYNKDSDQFMQLGKNNHVTLTYQGQIFSTSAQVLMAGAFLGLDLNDPYHNRVLFRDTISSNLSLANIYVEDTSDLPGEIWKQIKEAVGRPVQDFYYVSNFGRVKSIKHDTQWKNYDVVCKKAVPAMILYQTPDENGYYDVWLSAKQKPDITAQVHRLVAAAFCINNDPQNKTVVNHIDGNPSNNKAENLEWCTLSENAQHAVATGLKGDWKGRKLRYTVLHVEGNQLYDSLSDVDRALHKTIGYCSKCLQLGQPVKDCEGNVWTLEVFKDLKRKINGEGQHCTIDEFPGREFISLGEASLAIGRWEGYISDALKRGGVIRNKGGQVMHVHLVGDAPVVNANEKYKEKKAAGLIPEKKKRNPLNKTNLCRPLKHIETGIVYRSMSEANRAMGKKDGYLSECFAWNRAPVDKDGNVWTFEVLEQGSVHIHYAKNPCYIDELPSQQFANLTEASLAIGKSEGYIADRIVQTKPILSKEGQILHFHYIDPEKEAELQAKYAEASTQNKPKNRKLFNIH